MYPESVIVVQVLESSSYAISPHQPSGGLFLETAFWQCSPASFFERYLCSAFLPHSHGCLSLLEKQAKKVCINECYKNQFYRNLQFTIYCAKIVLLVFYEQDP